MNLPLQILFLIFFTYAISNIHVHKETLAKRKMRYGSKHIFLTHIGINLTVLINILNILQIKITPHFLIFTTALELTITILFYSLLILNERNLNVPDKTNKLIRNNNVKELSLHLLPFVYLINQNVGRIFHTRLLFLMGNLFFIFYVLLLMIFAHLNKEYCYPVLNKLKNRGRITLLLIGNLILNLCILIVILIKQKSF